MTCENKIAHNMVLADLPFVDFLTFILRVHFCEQRTQQSLVHCDAITTCTACFWQATSSYILFLFSLDTAAPSLSGLRSFWPQHASQGCTTCFWLAVIKSSILYVCFLKQSRSLTISQRGITRPCGHSMSCKSTGPTPSGCLEMISFMCM